MLKLSFVLILYLFGVMDLYGYDENRGFSPSRDKFFFMHVPRTGGTTLSQLIKKKFNREGLLVGENALQYKRIPENLRFVMGHIDYRTYKKIEPNYKKSFKFTILRNPIERYLSHIRIGCSKERSMKELFDEKKDLPGYYPNTYCKMLASDPKLKDELLLRDAIENLKTFDYIIFYENYSDDVADLFRTLRKRCSRRGIFRLNKTDRTYASIDKALQEEVYQRNKLDMKLYDYAMKHRKGNKIY